MPKRGRGGLEGNIPTTKHAPAAQSETRERSVDVEAARRAIIDRLYNIRTRKAQLIAETGEADGDRESMQGLEACAKQLDEMRHPTLRDIQLALFKHAIPLGQITAIQKQVSGLSGGLTLPSEELKDIVKAQCSLSIHEDLHFKNKGGIFLAEVVGASIKEHAIDTNRVRELNDLGARLRQRGYTEKNVHTMYMMYAALLADTSLALPGHTSEDVAIGILSSIVQARLKGDRENGRTKSEGNFFDRVAQCIEVYGDITQEVIRYSGDIAPDVKIKATRSLSELFQKQELQKIRWAREEPDIDPFQVLQNMLHESPDENPWIVESLENTPFDASKFPALITRDVGRGLLAETVLVLNNYQAELLSQRAAGLKRMSEEQGNVSRTEFEMLVEDCTGLLPVSRADMEDDEGKMEFLEKVERLSIRRSREEIESTRDVHPIAPLLRIISPEKIWKDDHIQKQFMQLFRELSVSDSPSHIAICGSSIRAALATRDPYLDMPLLAREDKQSLRAIFTEFADTHFSSEVRKRGPYIHLTGNLGGERPLYTPADLREYESNPERLRDLKKNFSSAVGIGLFKRGWLRAAAEKWNEQPDAYKQMMAFSKAIGEQFHGLDTGVCSLAFYRSATIATGDFVGNLMQLKEGDRVLVTNQEFTSVTREFSKRGAKITQSEIIYTNDRKAARSLSVEEMFEQYKANIEAHGIPRAIIISTKTRFGDAPCTGLNQSDPQRQRPNVPEIQRLVKLLKTAFPSVAVGLDGCQSIGRNDDFENRIERLGCDFFLSSGAKAMGVPEAATLVLRTKFPKNQVNWLSGLDEKRRKDPMSVLQPGVGTDNVVSIAALALAMQTELGRENPWSMNTIPQGNTLRDMTSLQNQRLTRYFIDEANKYSMKLLKDLFADPQISIARKGSEILDKDLARQFGCRVVYPIHRVERNYNGMATVTFPNIAELIADRPEGPSSSYTSEYLHRNLRERGFLVTPELLKGRHAIRVDFNMAQDTADVDALFAAIREIHIDFLRAQIKKKKITSVEQLRAETPNVPDDWMEN